MLRRSLILILLPLFAIAKVDIAKITEAAKSGNAQAIYQLGYIYENGLDVAIDKEKAYKLYKKAAKLGSSDAKLSLELLSLNEEIANRDVSKENRVTIASNSSKLLANLAVTDLKDIINQAKKGDKEALYTLGVMYENGLGPIKQSLQKATLFYEKAAKAGSKKASALLKLRNSR